MKLSSRRRISLILIGILTMIFASMAMAAPTDSVHSQRTAWHFVPRMQSLGLFAYGGTIGCENPTFDFNFSVERNGWGYFFFKSFDLENIHSHSNFALTMVYRKFSIGKKIELRPYLGFLVDQTDRVVGKYSDLAFVMTASYKLNDHWKVDNSSIFPHLVFNRDSQDWTNRVRIIYNRDHLELTLISWHNNKLLDRETYLSEGFSMFYNNIRLSDHAKLNTGVTGLWMLETSDEVANPKKNGLLLTLSVTLH